MACRVWKPNIHDADDIRRAGFQSRRLWKCRIPKPDLRVVGYGNPTYTIRMKFVGRDSNPAVYGNVGYRNPTYASSGKKPDLEGAGSGRINKRSLNDR